MTRLVNLATNEEIDLSAEVTFGRSSKNTVKVSGGNVSREHARVYREEGEHIVEDLKSSNGTHVNEERISGKQVLKDGDKLRIGDAIYRYVYVDPLVGRNLKGYQIRERLGEGGMGSVYLALQSAMDREVALKILKTSLTSDPEFVRRFESEAQLAGRLNHPNIVGVHDFGSADGLYFFSMEYVPGTDLIVRLKDSGAVPVVEALQILKQAAEGLAHAHGLGVLHQDIKPHNLMLTKKGAVKITDLGLAKTIEYGQEKRREKGKLIGTPAYMAPEVLRREPPTVASDVYSLGATLFHLVTGKPPFSGGSSQDIVKRRLNEPTPDPRMVASDLPEPVARFIMQLMEVDPAARPNGAGEVAAQIPALIEAAKRIPPKPRPAAPEPAPAPASAAPTAAAQRPARPRVTESKRNQAKLIMYLGSVALAGIICYVAWSMLGLSPEKQAGQRYEAAQALANNDDLDGAIRELDAIIENYDGTKAADHAYALRRELGTQRDLRDIEKQFSSGSLSASDATDKLSLLLSTLPEGKLLAQTQDLIDKIRAEEEKLAATNPTPTESGNAQAAPVGDTGWQETESEVDQLVQRGNIEDAAQALAGFIGKNKNSPEAERARKRLEELRQKAEDDLQARLREAREDAQAGRAAQAWTKLSRYCAEEPDIGRRVEYLTAMAELGKAGRAKVLGARKAFFAAAATLDTEKADKIADTLLDEVKDGPWRRPAEALKHNAKCLLEYKHSLGRAIEARIDQGFTIAIAGIPGECSLSLDNKDNLLAIPEGKDSRRIPWSMLTEDALWEIAPRDRIRTNSRLGAALHCAARGHWGYVRTFLKGFSPDVDDLLSYSQVMAAKDNRLAVEAFNYSSHRQGNRWLPVLGEWDTSGGNLAATGERSHAVLSGRIVNLRSAEVRAKVTRGPQAGVVRIAFDAGPSRIAVELRQDRSLVTYSRGGGAADTSGGDPVADTATIALSIANRKAALLADGKQICELDVPGHEEIDAILRIEFDAVTGSVDDLVLSEGE